MILAERVVLPTNRPERDGPKRSTRSDVDFALHRASRYLKNGGDRDAVDSYINAWLDYRGELELREEIAAL